MNVLELIKENRANLSKSETLVADYFLSNHDAATSESIQSIAKSLGTSTSTVMRFVRKMGFNGLPELRYAMVKSADKEKVYSDKIIIHKNDTIGDIIQKEKKILEKCANTTFDIITKKDLNTVVQKLKKAETIYLLGVGASGLVAYDLYIKLLRINKRCVFHTEENMQVAHSMNITKRDAVLAISYGGETRAVNHAAEQAKKNGAYCIAITRAEMSTLRSISDMSLFVHKTENEIRIGAICSRFSALMICDVIFLNLAVYDFENVENKLIESRKLSNRYNARNEKI